MFLNKVGSDACLVLDCEVTMVSTDAVFTVKQKFNFADIVEASKTRAIKLRCTTSNATIAAAMGDVHIADVVAFDSTNKYVFARGTITAGSSENIVLTFEKDADTGVWSGTFDLS